MGALPWTLRTSGVDQGPRVVTSESSPLPKSAKTANELEIRRGSLDDIHTTALSLSASIATTEKNDQLPEPPLAPSQQHEGTPLTTTNNMTTANTNPIDITHNGIVTDEITTDNIITTTTTTTTNTITTSPTDVFN
jgi:hypothetical protein